MRPQLNSLNQTITNASASVDSHIEKTPIGETLTRILHQNSVELDTKNFPASLYLESLLYMLYWFHRLRAPQRKTTASENISAYLNVAPNAAVVKALLQDQSLKVGAKDRVEQGLVVRKTVDILLMRDTPHGREFLTIEREFFPTGLALPGGLLIDEDEHNDAGIPPNIYAALRVTASKIFRATHAQFGIAEEEQRKYYFVRSEAQAEARIYMDRTISHTYRDHLKEISIPSDPRHLVDTLGFLVEIVCCTEIAGHWLPASVINTPYAKEANFAFGHHKQIAAALIAKNFNKQSGVSHHEWIREIVNHPLENYRALQQRFHDNKFQVNTSIIELLPVIDYVRHQLSMPAINEKCERHSALAIAREQLQHKLHHVTIQNGTVCPYEATLRVIFESLNFFDTACRIEKKLSIHFQKKYWYRYEELMQRIPQLIIIPTFDNISATDLMKIRGIPLYFIGVSPEPVYVDEFWQSPLEFLIHDLNHSWKMMDMDDRYFARHPELSLDQFLQQANTFVHKYLPRIAIQKSDTQEQKEIKKLKKIILFEVVHEDARPILPEIICEALLEDEGYEFPDSIIRYDESGQQAYLEQRTIPGITALSYVRHKLQHGFFDQTDSQNIQIVSPQYRSVDWIVKATVELLHELNANIPEQIQNEGLSAYLTRQACSRGPTILHAPERVDVAVSQYGDGTII
ncbi:hypothetical protein H8K35_15950 [Undibacterium sp. LX40W]|uniref:Uncharacterized protein n=1 Tax=Undibacterium nitidum TaxID=2762298 RepID=A0A923KQG1_9BURK|nr:MULTISPECIES: hypothetical protein [Undibacterium]MBC3882888.1 hypothetical protein [Undibacterium nitidum]MBC3893169.1 hypothetical protein [Undibacterium sp. LX40W]